MIITTTTETKYNVQMTADQRQALILALVVAVDNGDGVRLTDLSDEQKEVMQDLRVSLLNAS